MCGILCFTGSLNSKAGQTALATLRPRGPDEQNWWVSESPSGVFLANTRLAIQDLPGGRQPMEGPAKRIRLVYNGELFNGKSLREEREKSGVIFSTHHSDTEILAACLEHKGQEACRNLRGMFAYIAYDAGAGVLFGARDPLGIKPLHYSLEGGRFSAASEIKALRKLPWISREIDPQGVADSLSWQCSPSPGSVWKGIHKLLAGHAFRYDLRTKKLSIWRYWEPPWAAGDGKGRFLSSETLRTAFEEAVGRWSISDVPVTCLLSGGLDSTAVASVFARQNPETRFLTCTLGFHEQFQEEEVSLARKAANFFGSEHLEIRIGEREVRAALPDMVRALDEPYGGGIPSWFVYRELGKKAKVTLTGVGGDELFGGYGKWIKFSSWAKLRRSFREFRARGGGFFEWLRHPHASLNQPGVPHNLLRGILRPEWGGQVSGQVLRHAENLYRSCPSRDLRDRSLAMDLGLQLPEEFLMMTDRFSMAHSLEARVPLLDQEFVETVLRHRRPADPDDLKREWREAVAPLIPPELTQGFGKRGFILPSDQWLRGPWRRQFEESFSPVNLHRQGVFLPAVRDKVILPFLAGQDRWGPAAWTLFMFQIWHEHVFAQN